VNKTLSAILDVLLADPIDARAVAEVDVMAFVDCLRECEPVDAVAAIFRLVNALMSARITANTPMGMITYPPTPTGDQVERMREELERYMREYPPITPAIYPYTQPVFPPMTHPSTAPDWTVTNTSNTAETKYTAETYGSRITDCIQ